MVWTSDPKKKRADDGVVNMAPDADLPKRGDLPRPPRPSNITQTPAWNASKAGAKRFWSNYRETLGTAFKKMNRYQQEALIGRMCLVVTVGVTGLALLIFYNLVPRAVRVILVPAAIFAAWWSAKQIVTPVVLGRMEPLLNPPDTMDVDASDTGPLK